MGGDPILTLTMNPAVDVSSTVDTLEPYQKLRCSGVEHHPGGGGINVARLVKRLGTPVIAIFPSGGPMGSVLTRLLIAEGVDHISVPIAGDTREDFSVSEATTGKQFRFILPGPCLTPSEIDACLGTIRERLAPSSLLVASGSLPPSAPSDFYAKLTDLVEKCSAHLILDSSGGALREAVNRGGLFLIKPSLSELAELVGYPVADRGACIRIARDLVQSRRVEFVCVSLGSEGALLVGRDCVLFAPAPLVDVKTTIGAGDCLLAGLVWAFANHQSPQEALQLGVASGTASLLASGTGLSSPPDIQRLKAHTHVEHLESVA